MSSSPDASPSSLPTADSDSLRADCLAHIPAELEGSRPACNPIHLATVYECDDPEQADRRLGQDIPGYVYQRDRHPNGDALAEKCRRLHAADRAVVTASGMGAISLAMLSHLNAGDHVILSDRLYGRTTVLVDTELVRFGITSTRVNTRDLDAVAAARQATTRMLVTETFSNPMLRQAPLPELAEWTRANRVRLLVDNTFATPIVCQPLRHGADLVVESLTKMMNGHGDVTLGLLCGNEAAWERTPAVLASFGMTTSPFACWLAERGLATLYLRMTTASQTAAWLAGQLQGRKGIEQVCYPGLDADPTWLNTHQGAPLFGNMLTIQLAGDGEMAGEFIRRLEKIRFCPSLGDFSTTLSHPCSTSHRGLDPAQRQALGLTPGTIRFSIGLDSPASLLQDIDRALAESISA